MDTTDRFTKYLYQNGYKDATVRSYLQDVKLLLALIGGEQLLPLVTEIELSAIVHEMHTTRKPASIIRWQIAVKKFFAFCSEAGICAENPAAKMPLIEMKRPQKKQDCTSAVVESLLDALDASEKGLRNRAIIALICGTSIKINDLVRLKLGNFQADDATLQIENVFYLLDERTAHIVSRHIINLLMLHGASADSPMFMNRERKPMTRQGIWKIVMNTKIKAGIEGPVTAVGLRGSMVG